MLRRNTHGKTENATQKLQTPYLQSVHAPVPAALRHCHGLGLLRSGHFSLGIRGGIELPLLFLALQLRLSLSKLLLLLLCQTWQKRYFLLGVQVVVVGTDDGVSVVQGNLADVRNRLDLDCALLVLRISHLQSKLLSSALDRIPPSQPRRKMHVSRHAEVLRVDDFVCRWVVQNGLSMDTGFVREGAESRNVVVERLNTLVIREQSVDY
jgi:hypothetical protein